MAISRKFRVAVKRVLWVFIPAVLVLGLGVVFMNAYVIYRIAHPVRTKLDVSPRDFQVIMKEPMWFEDKWRNTDGTQSLGWLLSHGTPAPVIIMSHGYGANRSELMTLAFELWKQGYNILVYDLRGHGESPVKWSGLGIFEKDDLLSAIEFVKGVKVDNGPDAGKPLVDGRIGLYGVDLGGYVSLAVSSREPGVKAVAVDSVSPDAAHFINYRYKSYVGTDSYWAANLVDMPFMRRLTDVTIQTYLVKKEDSAPAIDSITTPADRKFLFIIGKDSGMLGPMTRDLYDRTVNPKRLIEVEKTRMDRLYDKDSVEYDKKVVEFFNWAMPVGTATGETAGDAAAPEKAKGKTGKPASK